MNYLKTPSTTFLIFAIVAGAIGIFSVFVTWTYSDHLSTSGWELIQGAPFYVHSTLVPLSEALGIYRWIPLLILVFSAVALTLGVILSRTERRGFGIGMTISGILMVAVTVLFNKQDHGLFIEYAGDGEVFAVVAGVIIIILGIVRILFYEKPSCRSN